MPKHDAKQDVKPEAKRAPAAMWTPEQLLAHKHLGPAIIGQEMHEAAQQLVQATDGGRFGPALLGIIPPAYQDQTPKAEPKDAA